MEIIDIYKNSQSHKILSLDKSRGMISHAYLLECSDKFLLDEYAMLMAEEIFCLGTEAPCQECLNCLKVEHSNMVDLRIYPKEKNIMVDDVVEIVSDSIQRPMDSEYKVYILKDFDSATTQAQNKILKTLEEPPHNVIFILTVSGIGAVLPTILSRVKRISEPLLDINIVSKYLSEKNINNASALALVSGGNISTALKLSSSGGADKIYDLAVEVLMGLRASSDILKYSTKIVALKKDFVYFIDCIIMILKDVIAFRSMRDGVHLSEQKLIVLASLYSPKAILEITDKLCEIYNKLEFNCNLVAIVDKMLLDILEVKFLCQK